MSFKRDFGLSLEPDGAGGDNPGSMRKKKRKSRWGEESEDKSFIPGMPTVLPQGLEKDQEELFLLQLQIEEISRRLRTGDLGIPPNPEDRSPSPEPIYNNEGKRLNTREYRTRKKLEEERHELIQKCCDLNTEYKPPSDYKPPVIKVTDKVMIPQEEHPDINFVGLLIGPRGNTLKNLEKETGAKIIIRGKGSVKEGKIGRKDGQPLPGEDEPLHAYITANNPEHVRKAATKIHEIIKQGIEVPEQQNDLRRQQLRELALLNGTLRENDGLAKLKQLQQAQTIITNTIVCAKCGGTGHLSKDCMQARPGDSLRTLTNQPPPFNRVDKAKMDSEYSALMAELGEGPPPSNDILSHTPQSKPPSTFTRTPNFSSPPPAIPPPQLQHPPPFSQPPPMSRPPVQQGPPPGFPPTSQPGHPPTMPPPPHSLAGVPPPPLSMSQPPPMSSMAPPPLMSQPPPASVSSSVALPQSSAPLPWQHPASAANSAPPTATMSTAINTSGPPPSMMAPPPPPPPTSQTLPWHHGPPPPQQANFGLPPPPAPHSGTGNPAPWQQAAAQQHSAPPPPLAPPPPSGNLPPWHQPPPPGPPGHQSHMLPPPPPPGQSFSNPAPPPPPPGSEGASIPAGIPLGVPPPPPPS